MDRQNQRIEQGIVEGCSSLESRGSVFGKYSDADMLFKLKRIALDPCDPKASFGKSGSLLNQTLRVRKVLSIGDLDCPRIWADPMPVRGCSVLVLRLLISS
ncbi:unnamed protein product [Cuscuta epithymum]|uniref:Uncharacterized protein n=1 Tax=Cuscuta epithymum TaxID=186058 RepID=A0AAV0GIQ7_9ASTE|nr:unnamed protein product [Cuscuta epithymum]